MRITGIDHVQIAVPRSLEGPCVSFYKDVLGLTQIPKPPELAGRGGAWFQVGALQLHVGVEDQDSPASKRHVCFLTDNLQSARQAAEKIGLPVEDGAAAEGLSRFFLRDPAGNRIEIASR